MSNAELRKLRESANGELTKSLEAIAAKHGDGVAALSSIVYNQNTIIEQLRSLPDHELFAFMLERNFNALLRLACLGLDLNQEEITRTADGIAEHANILIADAAASDQDPTT